MQPWLVWLSGLSAWEPKDHQFDSQSGHKPGLQSRSPVWGMREATDQCFSRTSCFSPSLSLSFLLSLKINLKIFKKLKCNMKGRIENKKKKTLNKQKEENLKNHANSEGEQSEICLSCWCSPSGSVSQLQVLLCYSWKKNNKSLLLILNLPNLFCRFPALLSLILQAV